MNDKKITWIFLVMGAAAVALLWRIDSDINVVGYDLCQTQRMMASGDSDVAPDVSQTIDSVYCRPSNFHLGEIRLGSGQ